MKKDDDWNPFLKKLRPPSMDDLVGVFCPKCGNSIWGRFFKLLKNKDQQKDGQLYTVPAYVCANCAEVLEIEPKKEEQSQQLTLTL